MPVFKITTVGASSGIILNKEAMARLRVKKGDRLYLTEAPGRLRLRNSQEPRLSGRQQTHRLDHRPPVPGRQRRSPPL